MLLTTTHDLFYLIGSVCIALVTIFLCWALYETARLVRQSNEMVEEARESIDQLEQLLATLSERLSSALSVLSMVAAGGKQALTYLSRGKTANNKKKKSLADDENE